MKKKSVIRMKPPVFVVGGREMNISECRDWILEALINMSKHNIEQIRVLISQCDELENKASMLAGNPIFQELICQLLHFNRALAYHLQIRRKTLEN